jgi:hypothetical protein
MNVRPLHDGQLSALWPPRKIQRWHHHFGDPKADSAAKSSRQGRAITVPAGKTRFR